MTAVVESTSNAEGHAVSGERLVAVLTHRDGFGLEVNVLRR
jgi:hypothetical protein